MRSTRRAHQAVEPATAGTQDPLAREPTGDRLLQCQPSRLSGQAVGEQPGAEGGLFLFAKLAHLPMGEHHAAVPSLRAAGELIAFEDSGRNADLTGKVFDNGGCDIRLDLWKARVHSPGLRLEGADQQRLQITTRKPSIAAMSG